MGQLLPALLSLQTERPVGGPPCSREGSKPALWVEISPRPPRSQAHRTPRSGVTSDPCPSVLHGIVQPIGSKTHAQTL